MLHKLLARHVTNTCSSSSACVELKARQNQLAREPCTPPHSACSHPSSFHWATMSTCTAMLCYAWFKYMQAGQPEPSAPDPQQSTLTSRWRRSLYICFCCPHFCICVPEHMQGGTASVSPSPLRLLPSNPSPLAAQHCPCRSSRSTQRVQPSRMKMRMTGASGSGRACLLPTS